MQSTFPIYDADIDIVIKIILLYIIFAKISVVFFLISPTSVHQVIKPEELKSGEKREITMKKLI